MVMRLSATEYGTVVSALRLAAAEAVPSERRPFCALLERLASQAAIGRAVQRRRRAALARGARWGA